MKRPYLFYSAAAISLIISYGALGFSLQALDGKGEYDWVFPVVTLCNAGAITYLVIY